MLAYSENKNSEMKLVEPGVGKPRFQFFHARSSEMFEGSCFVTGFGAYPIDSMSQAPKLRWMSRPPVEARSGVARSRLTSALAVRGRLFRDRFWRLSH